MVKENWLYSYLLIQDAKNNPLWIVGLLATYPSLVPHSQQWVNSVIRQWTEKTNIEIVINALNRANYYLVGGPGEYWVVENYAVTAASPFTFGSFWALDKESAENAYQAGVTPNN